MEAVLFNMVDYLIAKGWLNAIPVITLLSMLLILKYKLNPIYLYVRNTNEKEVETIDSIKKIIELSKEEHTLVMEELKASKTVTHNRLETIEKNFIKVEMKLDEILRNAQSRANRRL